MSRKTTASRKKAGQNRPGSTAEKKPVPAPTPVTKPQGPAEGRAERPAPRPAEPEDRDREAPEADETGAPRTKQVRTQMSPALNAAADLWQKVCRIEFGRIKRTPSWLMRLRRHRPSGLEIMVGLLILIAAIMVSLQLFGSRPRRHPTPAVLSRSDVRKVPPGVVQVLNTLERNAQVDRRTISRLEARLNSLRILFHRVRSQIKSRVGAPAPTAAPPPPVAPPAASPPSARPDRRLIDLQIRLDELSRKVKAMEKRLGRTRRPR